MTELTVDAVMENVYASLQNNNADLDLHIKSLKEAMLRAGAKTVQVETSRLAVPNRQGRKLMQAYFRQRGVNLEFTAA